MGSQPNSVPKPNRVVVVEGLPTRPTRLQVFQEMVRSGGGFVSLLGEAWIKADWANSERLLLAFPDYYAKYEVFATERMARDAKSKGGAS